MQVRVTAGCVRLEGINITLGDMGKWQRVAALEPLVEVVGGGKLVMEGCRVDGALSRERLRSADLIGIPSRPRVSELLPEGFFVAGFFGLAQAVSAVQVLGSGSCLRARRSKINIGNGYGLWVAGGANAVMEGCTVCECGVYGMKVEGNGSALHAWHCNVDCSKSNNISVSGNAQASLVHCTSNSSQQGSGWWVSSRGSCMTAAHSEASSNERDGAFVSKGARLQLTHSKCNSNR